METSFLNCIIVLHLAQIHEADALGVGHLGDLLFVLIILVFQCTYLYMEI